MRVTYLCCSCFGTSLSFCIWSSTFLAELSSITSIIYELEASSLDNWVFRVELCCEMKFGPLFSYPPLSYWISESMHILLDLTGLISQNVGCWINIPVIHTVTAMTDNCTALTNEYLYILRSIDSFFWTQQFITRGAKADRGSYFIATYKTTQTTWLKETKRRRKKEKEK